MLVKNGGTIAQGTGDASMFDREDCARVKIDGISTLEEARELLGFFCSIGDEMYSIVDADEDTGELFIKPYTYH